MKEKREEAKQKIRELSQEVSAKQGEVILVHRRIITAEARHDPRVKYVVAPKPDSCHHVETGLIVGGLVDRTIPTENPNTTITLDDISYSYSADIAVPVEHKLSKTSLHPFLNFNVEDLRKSGTGLGEVAFGLREIIRLPGLSLDFMHIPPYLASIDILIGDEKVKDFYNGRNAVRDLFRLLKERGAIQIELEHYDKKQRELFTNDLLNNVTQLTVLDRQVEGLEPFVLNARLESWSDKGDSPDYFYGKDSRVDEYLCLKKQISQLSSAVRASLENETMLASLKDYPIDGKAFGFPARVSCAEYVAYVRENILPFIDSRLQRINTYLKEEESRARKR